MTTPGDHYSALFIDIRKLSTFFAHPSRCVDRQYLAFGSILHQPLLCSIRSDEAMSVTGSVKSAERWYIRPSSYENRTRDNDIDKHSHTITREVPECANTLKIG